MAWVLAASGEGDELKLAGRHHASVVVALIALALLHGCHGLLLWLTSLCLVWESWRDRSGCGKAEQL